MGLTPDLSCPLWLLGPPPVVTPPQTPARTQEGSPAAHRLREGPGASWEGGHPLLPRRRQEVRRVFGAGEAFGPLVSLPASTLLLSPEAGGRRGCLSFTGVIPGPLRGRDAEEALPHLRWGVVGLGVWTFQSWGRGGSTRCLGGFLQTLPSSETTRSRFPLWGLGSSGALGTLQEEGPGAVCTGRGAGLASLPCCWGCTPSSPLLLSLCLASRAGSRPHQLWAAWPVCQWGFLCPPVPQSPCFVLLVAVLHSGCQ